MREKQALAAVQRFDGRHILRVQREIKQIEILLHPLLVRGFRDHGHTALHEKAQHKTLSFSKINGFNFLLRTELGFWDTPCREKMPASRFLVQTDPEVFNELVSASSLPRFTTDYGRYLTSYPDRVNIPLSDPEADVTFYLAARDGIPIL